MTRHRKTPADLRREALIQAGLRAPNTREFSLNACPEHSRGDDYALTRRLSRAKSRGHPPSALPKFPDARHPPVVWPGDNPFPIRPGLRTPAQGKEVGDFPA